MAWHYSANNNCVAAWWGCARRVDRRAGGPTADGSKDGVQGRGWGRRALAAGVGQMVQLVVLAKAGLVVVEVDGVRCSERRSGPTSTARRPSGGETGSRADAGSGGRRVARRRGGSDDGSDTGSTGGGVASEEEEATGRASRGASKRRRDVASYAESEQESEDDEGGGWD